MTPFELNVDLFFIIALMLTGFWLEGINGKHGLWDELLTPVPMALAGMMVLVERAWARKQGSSMPCSAWRSFS
jgi:hypothetical protein